MRIIYIFAILRLYSFAMLNHIKQLIYTFHYFGKQPYHGIKPNICIFIFDYIFRITVLVCLMYFLELLLQIWWLYVANNYDFYPISHLFLLLVYQNTSDYFNDIVFKVPIIVISILKDFILFFYIYIHVIYCADRKSLFSSHSDIY